MKDFKFITPVSMQVTKEQGEYLIKELNKLGYTSKQIDGWGDHPLIGTCLNNENGDCSNLRTDWAYGRNRYFINHYNPGLLLALAAMTDKEDGIVGEYWIFTGHDIHSFTNNRIYKQATPIQSLYKGDIEITLFDNNDSRVGIPISLMNNFRKATKEEIITRFTKQEEFKLPKYWYIRVTADNFDLVSEYWRKHVSVQVPFIIGYVVGYSKKFNGIGHNPATGFNGRDDNDFFENEITTEQFKKHVLKMEEPINHTERLSKRVQEMDAKRKIIGYKAPCDLWGGVVTKGTIYKPIPIFVKTKDWTNYGVCHPVSGQIFDNHMSLPGEIVEKWEPLYEDAKIEKTVTVTGSNKSAEVIVYKDGSVEVEGKFLNVSHFNHVIKNYFTPGNINVFGTTDWKVEISSIDIGCIHNIPQSELEKVIEAHKELNN